MKITEQQLESLQHLLRATIYIIDHVERGEELDPYERAWASHMLTCAKALDRQCSPGNLAPFWECDFGGHRPKGIAKFCAQNVDRSPRGFMVAT